MGTHLGPMIKHMNWVLTLVNALPEAFSGRFVPGKIFISRIIACVTGLTTQGGVGSSR